MSKNGSSNDTLEEFYREACKLEVRLDNYLKDEDAFANALRNCIGQFKSLHAALEKIGNSPQAKEISKALEFKGKVEEAFSVALISQGKAEHERSHLLESYGALILALQV
jgi:hypothetical protein